MPKEQPIVKIIRSIYQLPTKYDSVYLQKLLNDMILNIEQSKFDGADGHGHSGVFGDGKHITGGSVSDHSITGVKLSPALPGAIKILQIDGSNNLSWINLPTVITDHGALTGLGDDDHHQYLLLLGRAGGQTFYGGTDITENLNIFSTSHAYQGLITLGSNTKILGTLDMNNNTIENVPTPLTAKQIANKFYVDAVISVFEDSLWDMGLYEWTPT